MMKFSLPATVASTQDLAALTTEMREYARWFAHESIKRRLRSKRISASPTLSPQATELLRTWNAGQTQTRRSLDGLLRTLEEYRKKARIITITLPALPTATLRTTIVAWCRHNIAGNALISFRFNATLLGGMVVRDGSRIFDWSFKRQLLAAREQFPEVLRRV